MSEESNHTHHHHHHHRIDGASKFKRDSLLALHRRKVIEKWLWRSMIVIAVMMAIAVIIVYTIG